MIIQGGRTSLAELSTRHGRRSHSSLARPATILAFAALLSGGGGVVGQQAPTGWSAGHKFTANLHVVQNDLRLPKNHQLIQDLKTLREDLASTPEPPLQKQPVTISLFADAVSHAQYLQTAYPNLPPRRANFVGNSDELAVYTFWGDKIQEDLRHKFTHGVLHASLKDVPLWLAEVLAEYSEVYKGPRGAFLSDIANLRFEDRPPALSARPQNTLPSTECHFLTHATTLSQTEVTEGAVRPLQ